jgi:hypothetical protein
MRLTGGDLDFGESALASSDRCGDLDDYEYVLSQKDDTAQRSRQIYAGAARMPDVLACLFRGGK